MKNHENSALRNRVRTGLASALAAFAILGTGGVVLCSATATAAPASDSAPAPVSPADIRSAAAPATPEPSPSAPAQDRGFEPIAPAKPWRGWDPIAPATPGFDPIAPARGWDPIAPAKPAPAEGGEQRGTSDGKQSR